MSHFCDEAMLAWALSVPALLAEGTEIAMPRPLSPRLPPRVACAAGNLEGLSVFLERDQDCLQCKWSSPPVLCSSAVIQTYSVWGGHWPLCVTPGTWGEGGSRRYADVDAVCAVLRVVQSFVSDPRTFCLLAPSKKR